MTDRPLLLSPRTGRNLAHRLWSWFYIPLLQLLLASAVALAFANASWAVQPSVQFDVSHLIECHDVTTEDFASSHPHEKLVEARFQVSSLLREGDEQQIIHFLYRIENPHQSVRVVDYLPRTTLSSGVVGHVGIEKTRERNHSIGIGLTGNYDHYAKADATASTAAKNSSNVRYELLPPKELLAASGTMGRGTGAYFKLKPSPQTSLEGAKDFGLVMRVPENWRGDLVRIHCQAVGVYSGVVPALDDRPGSCGEAQFTVALYVADDPEARELAVSLVQAEHELKTLAYRRRDELRRRSYPSAAHLIGRALSIVDPKIPTGWVSQQVATVETAVPAYERHLPEKVRAAVRNYREAKSALFQLNGLRP